MWAKPYSQRAPFPPFSVFPVWTSPSPPPKRAAHPSTNFQSGTPPGPLASGGGAHTETGYFGRRRNKHIAHGKKPLIGESF